MAADGSVVIQITGDDKEFKASLHSLGDVATAALKGVATAIAAAGAAIAGLAVAAAKVGAEFETSLAATSTMFGDVEVDTEGLTTQILELSNASGVAAKQISDSLYNALSAGIPVTEDMIGAMDFMERSTKLAAAGFTDVDTAVTATAKVMNAYGMTVDDVDQIQKVMLQTQNKGITTVNELGSTLAQVTPTAAAMGVSFENVGAALATMTAQGTPTAQATTQLNSLIAELGKNGTAAAKNLAAATEGTEYAGKSFKQLMDAGVPLNEVLDLMAGYADENSLSMIDMFSSIEAGKAALSIAGENSAAFADNLTAMSTEADVVGDAYAKVTDTLDHKIGVLKESVSNLGIAVYDEMSGPLKEAAGMATDWISQITDAFSQGGLEGAVGALGNVLAEAVTYIANLAPKMIDAGIRLLQALLTGIQQNLPALAQGAVGIVTSLINGIVTLLPQLAMTSVQLIGEIVKGLLDSIPTLIDSGLELMEGLADGILQALPSLTTTVPEIAGTILRTLTEQLPRILEKGTEILRSLITGIVGAIPQLIVTITQLIPQIVMTLAGLLPEIVEAGIEILSSLITGIVTAIPQLVAAIPQIIIAIVGALITAIPQIIEAGIKLILALPTAFIQAIPQIIQAVPQIIDGLKTAFLNYLEVFKTIGKNLITGLWEGISGMGGWIMDQVKGFFGGVVNGVKNFLGIHSPSRVFSEIGGNTMEGFAEGVDSGAADNERRVLGTVGDLSSNMTKTLGNGGGDAGTQLMSKLTKSASAALSDVKTVASTSVKTFCDAVVGDLVKVGAVAESIAATICDTILSKHKEFYYVGVDAMNGFNEGLEIQGRKAIATARRIADSIIWEMQRALDIHSPSRKMRDLVGIPTAQGFMVGFEEEMEGLSKKMQSAIDAETTKLSFQAATQAENKAASSGVTREVYKSTNTVEKVAHIEGDGVTGELVRMLGLRIKVEDNRVGDSLVD